MVSKSFFVVLFHGKRTKHLIWLCLEITLTPNFPPNKKVVPFSREKEMSLNISQDFGKSKEFNFSPKKSCFWFSRSWLLVPHWRPGFPMVFLCNFLPSFFPGVCQNGGSNPREQVRQTRNEQKIHQEHLGSCVFFFLGKYNTRYCSWFRIPVQKLRLVVSLLICKVLYIPGGCLGFHQQYGPNNQLILSRGP